MATTITVKGQVTIPKHIRDALKLTAGCQVEFAVENENVVMFKAGTRRNGAKKDRFDRALGVAEVKWRTDELMALLRGESIVLVDTNVVVDVWQGDEDRWAWSLA